MGVLNVDTAQMTKDADGFSRISTVADQIASYLQNSLNLLGNFWGNDEVGGKFLDQWGPATNGLIAMSKGASSGMLATANSVTTSADLYKKSNVINTELVR